MYINEEEIVNHISAKPFHLISEAAEELGVEVYVIGGYVRDIFLNRPSKDIDVVAGGQEDRAWCLSFCLQEFRDGAGESRRSGAGIRGGKERILQP